MAAAKRDPELVHQLVAAEEKDTPVQAVFVLRGKEGKIAPDPDEMQHLTADLMKRAAEKVGYQADASNVFRNLGSFVVSARPAFVKHLMQQPEIATVMANRKSSTKDTTGKRSKRRPPST